MVIAARSRARTGSHERINQCRGDLANVLHFLLDQKRIEQAQRLFFGAEVLSQRTLVSEELLDSIRERAVEAVPSRFHRTSSPMPEPTSRRASTATLA